jgi:lysozyme family protein
MDRNFSRALNAVLDEEGGYVNHPNDPGGPTNMGVTIQSFRDFVKPGGTVEDLKKLTRDQAGVVYRRRYWDEVMGTSLPDGLDAAMFDFAVNSGPGRAAKYLQRLLGVPEDGKIGPQTLAQVAVSDAVKLINGLCDDRLAFLKRLETWPTFGKGWAARIRRVRTLSLQLAEQPADAPVVIEKRVEKPVAVTPAGVEKRGSTWWTGLTGMASGGFMAFTNLDTTGKLLVGGVVVIAFGFFIWRGEMIVRRVKTLVAEIGRG